MDYTEDDTLLMCVLLFLAIGSTQLDSSGLGCMCVCTLMDAVPLVAVSLRARVLTSLLAVVLAASLVCVASVVDIVTRMARLAIGTAALVEVVR